MTKNEFLTLTESEIQENFSLNGFEEIEYDEYHPDWKRTMYVLPEGKIKITVDKNIKWKNGKQIYSEKYDYENIFSNIEEAKNWIKTAVVKKIERN